MSFKKEFSDLNFYFFKKRISFEKEFFRSEFLIIKKNNVF